MRKETEDFVAGKEYARKRYAKRIAELNELSQEFSSKLYYLERTKNKIANVLNAILTDVNDDEKMKKYLEKIL